MDINQLIKAMEKPHPDGRVFSAQGHLADLATAASKNGNVKPVSTFKVKSKQHVGKNVTVGNLNLSFNDAGVAECPEHLLAEFVTLQIHQPGQFEMVTVEVPVVDAPVVVDEVVPSEEGDEGGSDDEGGEDTKPGKKGKKGSK